MSFFVGQSVSADSSSAMATAVDSSNYSNIERNTPPKQAKYTQLGKTPIEQNAIGIKNIAGQCFTFPEINSSCSQMCELTPNTQQNSEQFQRETRSLLEAMQNEQRYSKGSPGQPNYGAWRFDGFSMTAVGHITTPSYSNFPNMGSASSYSGNIGFPPAYHYSTMPQGYSAKYGLGSNHCVPRQTVYPWRHI